MTACLGTHRIQAMTSLLLIFLARGLSAAVLEEDFKPRIEMEGGGAIVYSALPLADGKMLIAGHFSSVNGVPRRHLASLNTDGSLDQSFNPGAISFFIPFGGESSETAVHSAVVQNDSKILIGGFFNYINNTERRFLARLNADGSLDSSFQVELDNRVDAITLQPDGKILIAGQFTLADFLSRGRVARLNPSGSVDTTFTFAGASHSVFSIAVQGDKIWLGGGFSSLLNPDLNRALVARLHADGRVDPNFDLGLTNIAFTLAPVIYSVAPQPDGKLVIGGNFLIFGTNRLSIARLNANGSLDESFRPDGVNGSVHSVALQRDGKVLLGGRFTLVNNLPRDNVVRLNADGSLDDTFLSAGMGADGIVERVIVTEGGHILMAGRFSSVAGQPRTGLARFKEESLAGPSLLVTPAVVTNDYTGKVVLSLRGLQPEQAVSIDVYLDENANQQIDAGEPIGQSLRVTDGLLPAIDGVRNANVPGDEDSVVNGEIRVELDLARRAEVEGIPAQYLFRVSGLPDTTPPVTAPFTIVPKSYSQGVTGTVLASGANASPSGVLLLLYDLFSAKVSAGGYSDATGRFSLFTLPGFYALLPFKEGFGTSLKFETLTLPSLQLIPPDQILTQDVSVIRGDRPVAGTVRDMTTGAPLRGVVLFALSVSEDSSRYLTIGITDGSGHFELATPAGELGVSFLPKTLARLGYLSPGPVPTIDATTNPVAQVTIDLPKATALIHGRITGRLNEPLAGLQVAAREIEIEYETVAETDQQGNFVLGVTGGRWELSVNADERIAPGYDGYGVELLATNNLATRHDVTLKYNRSEGPPDITGFSPVNGPVGTIVTITGTNFLAATKVLFNGEDSSFTVDSPTQIQATILPGTSSGPISVTTPLGTATTTNPFSITLEPPTIFTQPLANLVFAGARVVFSISAGGSEPLTYQWRRDEIAIPGGTNNFLVLTNAQVSDAGVYSALVSNTVGAITSSNAVLTVTPVPVPGFPVIWTAASGGPENDWASSVGVDGNGNSYVTGVFRGSAIFGGWSGGTTLQGRGGADVFAAKYDSRGNFLWVKHAGGSGNDRGDAVAVDAAGNFYVTGIFEGNATFDQTTVTSAGDSDVFLARYDPDGKLQWVQRAGGNGADTVWSIAVGPENTVTLCGAFAGTAGFGSRGFASHGGADLFVVRYAHEGNVLWASQAGGAGDDYATSIAVDTAGNAFVTGSFSETTKFGDISLSSAGLGDVFIAKYSPAGDLLWAKRVGGSGDDSGFGIAVNSAGGLALTGSFTETADFGTGLTASGAEDIFVARLDSSGQVLWAIQAGGADSDQGYAVVLDHAGNSYVTGFFQGAVAFGNTNLTSSAADIFVARYNASGQVAWVRRAGSGRDDYGYGLALDAQNNLFLAGAFSLNVTLGHTNLISWGGTDALVLVLAADVSPPAAPVIKISAQSGNAVISWPTNQANFVLEYTESLSSPARWTISTRQSATIGDRLVLTDSLTGSSRFYRLRALP